ncbi:sensor domain-containing diguanylate cyclase [Paenibacillus caui]|uniref:sensor domain-containing diguanylate cyclase n=1 Tax=Paenibacillus caui TaxID=2873927 RepID=UPI003B58A66F
MSITMNTLFSSMKKGLETLANEFSEVDPARQSQEIQSKLDFFNSSNNYFNSVTWTSEQGYVLKTTPSNLNLEGKRLQTEPTNEALTSKKPTLSVPYIGATGRLIVLMTEPVFNKQGVYKGFIGGTIYLEENNILDSIFGVNRIDRTGSYFLIVDSTGKLIYHPEQNLLGKDLSDNQVVQKLIQGQSGKESVVNSFGVPFLAGYSTVAHNQWGIIVQTPISMVIRQQNEQVSKMLMIMLPSFLFLMCLTIFMARKVAAPFVFLANFVGKAASSKEKLPIPLEKNHWNWEADLLTKTVLHSISEMQQQSERLNDSARKDPLTGLMNRRSFEEFCAVFDQNGQPFSLLILDIDRFKYVNDTFGHLAGDEVLKFLSQKILSSVRAEDLCFRFGGEEFIVILPNTRLSKAFLTAERIRKDVERSDTLPIGRPVTVSIGIAEYPAQSSDFQELFEMADKALYRAKEEGRNRTIVSNCGNSD